MGKGGREEDWPYGESGSPLKHSGITDTEAIVTGGSKANVT